MNKIQYELIVYVQGKNGKIKFFYSSDAWYFNAKWRYELIKTKLFAGNEFGEILQMH